MYGRFAGLSVNSSVLITWVFYGHVWTEGDTHAADLLGVCQGGFQLVPVFISC